VPETGYPNPLTTHRQMMNTLNVELSDHQTKFQMMQTEIELHRDQSQNLADKSTKTFLGPLGENRVSSIVYIRIGKDDLGYTTYSINEPALIRHF